MHTIVHEGCGTQQEQEYWLGNRAVNEIQTQYANLVNVNVEGKKNSAPNLLT